MTKYIFVTGGVVSSLGKGIVAASLGKLLRARGYSVTIQKFDPYINVDPGTMSPFQHGEVFVTDDGAETDLDLGHYERFINTDLGKVNNVTSGSIYLSVITKERKGDYLGATVQTIPHITNEIKSKLKEGSKSKPDFLIAEVGGTVGDIEGLPFLEAIRQFKIEAGFGNALFIHVTLLPYLAVSGELKTKPSQHSVITLRSIGIQPDILVCRTQQSIPKTERKKLALFTNVTSEAVIECRDLKSIYEVPLALETEGLANEVLKRLNMDNPQPEMGEWDSLVKKIVDSEKVVKIGIAGKYTKLSDAYISIVESLKHAGAAENTKIEIKWISSDECNDEEKAKEALSDIQGLIIPGGFGYRGIEGKVNVIKIARETNLPFLGLCLGMQCSVIEFARNVAKFEDANSSEFEPECTNPIVDLMPDQEGFTDYGGSMRLGAYECHLQPGTKVREIYGQDVIYERHRHRYEVNNDYRNALSKAGLVFSGLSPDSKLVEIIENPNHKFFVATQFHPEFKSRLENPHPLFVHFVKAALTTEQQTTISEVEE